MIKWLILVIVAALAGQMVREVLSVAAGRRGPKLINRAADRLPEAKREVRRSEWLAEYEWLAQRSAYVLSLRFAIGVWIGAVRIRQASQDGAEARSRKLAPALRGWFTGLVQAASEDPLAFCLSAVVGMAGMYIGYDAMSVGGAVGIALGIFAATLGSSCLVFCVVAFEGWRQLRRSKRTR